MRGGRRPGAGRKRGSPNKATRARQERAAAGGLMPVDYLLSVMRNSRMPTATRVEAAVKVAPYLHPKLAAVEPNATQPSEVIEKLANERVQQIFAQMLADIDGAGTGLPPVKACQAAGRTKRT